MINHFKGNVQIPLKEIIQERHMHSTYPLRHTKHGQLEVELQRLGILERAWQIGMTAKFWKAANAVKWIYICAYEEIESDVKLSLLVSTR